MKRINYMKIINYNLNLFLKGNETQDDVPNLTNIIHRHKILPGNLFRK